MQKILVLSSTFPRWQGDKEPPFVHLLCQQLSQHYDVYVLAPHAPNCAYQETWGEIHVHRFRYFFKNFQSLTYHGGILANLKQNAWRYLLIPFFLIGQIWALKKICRQHDFALIHAHWIVPQGLLALSLGKSRPPILCTAHGGDIFALQHPLLQKLKRYVLNQIDGLSVVSQAMYDQVMSLTNIAGKTNIIPMGVDLQQYFVPELQTQRLNQHLLFVGRLVEKKGLIYLLTALASLKIDYPAIQLDVIGTGLELAHYQQYIKQQGLEKQVRFLGAIENKDLPFYYQQASMVIFPSIVAKNGDREGFGLVLVEALGCACPVISTDLAAMTDIIRHQHSALIIPQADSHALNLAIKCLLDKPEQALKLGVQGCNDVRSRYDWDIIGKAYKQVIQKLID